MASALVHRIDFLVAPVIRAQFGHVSPAMMAVYSHVRRKALDEAASALEPEAAVDNVPPASSPRNKRSRRVMSHVTSQQGPVIRKNFVRHRLPNSAARPKGIRGPDWFPDT